MYSFLYIVLENINNKYLYILKKYSMYKRWVK
nr:MAG TPA: hypothetical protein [Bacteriophage sp.]DAR91017.1 MAG TPA: hypothetical protein [Caudoviricetes sp.]DAS88363.1 MAG TPA: hypothetical protein [Bacteriophage sp.]